MKRTLLTLLVATLFFTTEIYCQVSSSPMPQRSAPTEQDKERMKREAEERTNEYIKNFLTTLESDDFQKEIIKQYLDSYVIKKTGMLDYQFQGQQERIEALELLNKTHFIDIKDLISENDYESIQNFINGKFDDSEIKKEKRKKKKKKKKKE